MNDLLPRLNGRSFRLDVTGLHFLSGERFYRRFVTVENLEQIENTYQAQSLYRKFRRLYQLDRSAALLDRSEKLHQQANSAGIDHVNFGQVQGDSILAIGQCFLKGLAQLVDRRAHSKRPPKLHDLHL